MCVFGGWWKGEEVSQLPIHNINLLKLHHKFCSGFPFHQSERGSGIHHGSSEEGLLRSSSSCCSVTQSCPTLCNSMDYSTPGFPVLHHLLKLAQTDVHWVSGAIQPSRPLSLRSPPGLVPVFCASPFPLLCFPLSSFLLSVLLNNLLNFYSTCALQKLENIKKQKYDN